MWNERFSTSEYVFGEAPAQFLVAQKACLTPGAKTLVVADGEGRNSVWLAEQGLDVTAFDFAPAGVEKARALAARRDVDVDFRIADIFEWDWTPDAYDAVVGVFIQFAAPPERDAILEGMKRTVKPGGLMLLHGYTPRQLDYGTGGPPDARNMYTEAQLADRFDGWEILRLAEYDMALDEGAGHAGMSALIDLVARKPAAD